MPESDEERFSSIDKTVIPTAHPAVGYTIGNPAFNPA
jgi:hypothetical protein